MNINKFYSLLFELYGEEKGLRIKHTVQPKNFSEKSFYEKQKENINNHL